MDKVKAKTGIMQMYLTNVSRKLTDRQKSWAQIVLPHI